MPRWWSTGLMVLMLIAAPLEAAAQGTGPSGLDVAGRVIDATTGLPLDGTSISIGGTDLRTLTDADGRFLLRGIPAGEHTWVIERLGYAAWEQSIEVAHLDQLAIGLMPRPVALERIEVTVDRLEARRKLASVSVHTVDRASLRSAVATVAAELVPDRMPWPRTGCPAGGAGSGPSFSPGAAGDASSLVDPGQKPTIPTELCIRHRGAVVSPGYCLDDRPITLVELIAFGADEIYAIDYIGGLQPQVRLYTERFLESGKRVRPIAFGCR